MSWVLSQQNFWALGREEVIVNSQHGFIKSKSCRATFPGVKLLGLWAGREKRLPFTWVLAGHASAFLTTQVCAGYDAGWASGH